MAHISEILKTNPAIAHLAKSKQITTGAQTIPREMSPPGKTQQPKQARGGLAVKQANEITEARYDFTSLELNLFMLCLRTLKQQGEEAQFSLYHFDLDDVLIFMGDSHNNLELLRKAARTIVKKDVEMIDREANVWTITHLISGMKIDVRNRKVHFTIDHFIKPYYFSLVKNFTLIYLESVLAMRSKYAKRIYSMCARFRDTGKLTISIEELRARLAIAPDKYTNLHGFKTKVLNIAIDEINEVSDLNVNVLNEWRRGAKNEVLDISIKPKGPESKIKQNNNLAERLRKAGLSELAIHRIFFFCSEEQISRALYDLSLAIANRKIQTNNSAYLIGIFKNIGCTFAE